MLSHWVGGWGNHCWSVGGQCSLPSLVFVILEQQCSGEMVSNQFNVKCRNKSFRQNGFISEDDVCKYNQFRMASFSNWRFIPPSSSSGYGHDGHGGHGGLKSNQAHTVVLDHLPIHPNELKVKIFIRPPIKYINDKDSYIGNKKIENPPSLSRAAFRTAPRRDYTRTPLVTAATVWQPHGQTLAHKYTM